MINKTTKLIKPVWPVHVLTHLLPRTKQLSMFPEIIGFSLVSSVASQSMSAEYLTPAEWKTNKHYNQTVKLNFMKNYGMCRSCPIQFSPCSFVIVLRNITSSAKHSMQL